MCLGHQVGPRAAHQVRFRVRLGGAFRERSEGVGVIQDRRQDPSKGGEELEGHKPSWVELI